MKIAVSASGKAVYDLLDVRFGRCEYFQIHDTENGEVKVVENSGKISGGGAGIAAAQQLIDEGIDTIITGNLGPNAFEIIEKADVKVYKSEGISISEVLKKHKNGELSELKTAAPAHNGMGNGFRGGK
ncbi:NifB/NifX family molybdenum-iron cluster-binding protein [Haloimpatiens lingqiaonensis]|uniref:NifB/NifX family molybdenum-iron cluster-binding protein n=1 Tax=Haloimpatiens lingqiaonensis TaxID=1380675 RepID=UPI0010FCF5A7|nr:NifB/NifX family molybdenum-iron cluster-binding protein [Haloimpatiens lingqiaonensis]